MRVKKNRSRKITQIRLESLKLQNISDCKSIIRIAEIRSPSPFESSVLQVLRPLFKAVPSRISRWRPCFHYTAQCPVLDHFHPSLSLSIRLVGPFLYSCSTFCKSSDISTGMRSTFNLAPVNERTLISLSRVSRVRDSGVAWWVLRYAHNEPLAFRHRAWWFFNYSIRPDV